VKPTPADRLFGPVAEVFVGALFVLDGALARLRRGRRLR
jgi:hypothetical protein